MKNKKGFTLIELLAVIIILGILLIIAVPAVTKFITDSRKETYVDTAKRIMNGAKNLAYTEEMDINDKNTTYYVPASYIKTENEFKSPYGNFTEAYVGIIVNDDGHEYYWISTDDTGHGINNITSYNELDEYDVVEGLNDNTIKNIVETTGIGNRNKIYIFDIESKSWIEKTLMESVTENGVPIVCKKATVLHTAECTATNLGCFGAGYVSENKGTTITYGTIPNGTPKAGDAYDCKLSMQEGYNERFYYVKSDEQYSTLIYYKNINNQETYVYDNVDENWHGPRNAYQYLPSKSEWDNPKIIPPGTRQIVAEDGNQINTFTYNDKSARLLTYSEVKRVCGESQVSQIGYLDNCNWLMENIGYYESDSGTRSYGYWLETPIYSSTSLVYRLNGYGRLLNGSYANLSASFGVRPVITIKTSFIE